MVIRVRAYACARTRTDLLISRPGSKADEGFFYNRGRGPIRSKVLNPFIRRAMMHEPLPSERIKGALRVRWREGGTCDCNADWDEPASAPIKIIPVSLL